MCEFRVDMCKLVDWETLMNKKDMLAVDVLTYNDNLKKNLID